MRNSRLAACSSKHPTPYGGVPVVAATVTRVGSPTLTGLGLETATLSRLYNTHTTEATHPTKSMTSKTDVPPCITNGTGGAFPFGCTSFSLRLAPP